MRPPSFRAEANSSSATFNYYPTAGVRATVAVKNGYRLVWLSRVYDYSLDGEDDRPYWPMEAGLG